MEFIVTEESQDLRLEKFLRNVTNCSEILFKKLIRKGKVTINNEKVKNGRRVNTGEIIKVFYSIKPSEQIEKEIAEKVEDLVIFENDRLIAINKKPGMFSQGGVGVKNSLDEIMHNLWIKRNEKINPYMIVHRLDKETSGVMIFAKGQLNASIIGKMFKERSVKKVYLTVLDGILEKSILIDKGIKSDPYKCSIDDSGKEAISVLYPIKHKNQHTLCFVEIQTGRKHQVRVHAASINHPVSGDELYGSPTKRNIFLHSFFIEIEGVKIFSDVAKDVLKDFNENFENLKEIALNLNLNFI